MLFDGYNDDYEIFVMNADGSEQRNISNHVGVDWLYYAEGDRLYFISDRDSTKRRYYLYEMKWDGSEVRRITDFLVHDSWMSARNNGKELIVSINENDDFDSRDLFIISNEGEILSQLTNDEFNNTDAHFSPDGSQIVFRSNRAEVDELYIMNDDGSNIKQLTYYPADDTTAQDWEYHAGPPNWSIQNRISYISKQNNNYSIFSIAPDGSNFMQITPDTTAEGLPANQGWHSWSRGDSLIAYNATDWQGNYDIYIMNADGSNIRRLTDGIKYEQAPFFVYPE